MEDIVAKEGEYNPWQAHCHEQDFANKDKGALARFMNRVDVVPWSIVVFEAEPTELMTTWACHVWTTCRFFDWNLALGALVCQKQKIDEPNYSLKVESCGLN